MSKSSNKPSKKVGLPPGTLIYTGKKSGGVRISLIDFDESQIKEKVIKTIKECASFRDKSSVTWINIDGIHKSDVIQETGECFNLHPLILEDIMNVEQRPMIEDFEDYLFVVLKMVYHDETVRHSKVEHVSFVLGSHYLISFQEEEGDVFNIIRNRIREGKGRIRKMGCDYLLYSLIDAIVDGYFTVLERIGEKIEDIEEEVIRYPTPKTLQTIYGVKRELIFLRKSVWPLREVVNKLEKCESSLIKEDTERYFRDVYDHSIQVAETIESFRDMNSGMLDIYLSSVSNRMNEVMKVLTIIATIFIPLTFIAGIYGMNFQNMPELEWNWGYFLVLLIMLFIGIIMIIYFRRKKWL